MKYLLTLIISSCFCQLFLAQDTLFFNEKYLESNVWKELNNSPDFISAIELDYNKDWSYQFTINDTVIVNEKVFYAFSLLRKNNLDNRCEITTFIVNKIDNDLYTTILAFHTSNFPTGLHPREEIHSILKDGRLTVYYLDEVIEIIDLGLDSW